MIKLELEIAEVNGILTALSMLSYKDVVQLINKIQTQAQPQVNTEEKKEPKKEE